VGYIFSARRTEIALPKFIHERKAWPAFRWRGKRLVEPLASLRFRQGHLLGRMESLESPLRAEATLCSLTEEVIASSEIEGEKWLPSQVRPVLARRLGADTASPDQIDRRVEGAVEVALDATQRFGAALTARRLCDWHASLCPSLAGGGTGVRWRRDSSGPTWFVSGAMGARRIRYEAPAAKRLTREMRQFLAWFDGKTTMDPVLKAAIAPLWYASVHPFDEGNGPIARALAAMALARAENSPQRFYSLSAQLRMEMRAYADVLETTQRSGLDITEWLEWFLGCLGRAIDGAQLSAGSLLAKARVREGQAVHAYKARQRLILDRLLEGSETRISSSRWAALGQCSQDTASRDIGDLMKRGILIKQAGGGRSTSYSLARPPAE
jgi:Fic family protein